MAQDKINTIIDRKAVSEEIKQTSKEVKDFIALLQSVKGKSVDVSQAKNMQEYAKLRKELEALIAQTNSATTAAIADAEARKAEAGATNLERKALQELYKAQILEEKARQESLKTTEKESAAKKKATGISIEEKIANQEAAKIQKERIQIRNAEDGSLQKMNLQYNKLTRIIYGFNEEQRNSSRGQTLVKYAAELNEKLKESDAKLNTFKRNVGNYANSMASGFNRVAEEIAKVTAKGEAAKSSFNNLAAGRTTIKGFSQGNNQGIDPQTTAQLQQFANEAQEADAALAHLNTTAQIGFQTSGNLKSQVKQLETAYQNMASSGKVSEQFLKEFAKFTAEAKDQLLDLKGEIKALSSDTYAFDQLNSVVQTTTGVFQVGASAAELFGGENQNVQKSIQKLLVIQNIANGVQQIANQLTLRGSVLNKAYVFTQTLLTTALNTSASAAIRFQAALGFIGIIAAVIGGLVLAFSQMSKETHGAERAQSQLRDTMAEVNTAGAEQVAELQTLLAVTQDATQSLDDRRDATNRILKIQRDVNLATGESIELTKDESGVLKENQKEWDKLVGVLVRVEKTKALLSSIGDAYKKVIEAENKSLSSQTTAVGDFIRTLTLGSVGGAVATTEKALKNRQVGIDDANSYLSGLEKRLQTGLKSGEFDLGGALGDGGNSGPDVRFFTERLELQKDNLLKLADNEDKFLADRLKAREQAADKERLIAEGTAYAAIKNAKFDKEEIARIRESLSVQLERISLKETEDLLKIQKGFNQKVIELVQHNREQRNEIDAEGGLKELQTEAHEKKIKAIEDDFEIEIAMLDQTKKKKLEKLSEQFREGAILEKEYNEEKEKIDTQFRLKELQAQIDFAKKLVQIKKAYGFDTTDDEKKLALLQIELDNQVTENHITNNEKKKKSDDERIKDLAAKMQTIGQLENNISQAITEIASIGFEQSRDRVDQEIEDLEKKKEADIAYANTSIANEKERAAVIFNITETEKAKQEALSRRKRQIQTEQAKFERALNISEIIQRTALAVVTTLGDKTIQPGFLRIPLAISVGALGLAQLVRAVAAPLPRFAGGGEVKQSGLILVGDANRSERVDTPSGDKFKTPAEPTVIYAEAGTIVHSDFSKVQKEIEEDEKLAMKLISIKKFATGGEVREDSVIMVGDGGKHEKMNFPDGSFIKTPKVPTLMHAIKGTKIDPDYDKAMTKASVGQVPSYEYNVQQVDTINPELLQEVKGMRRDIQNMPQSEIHVENLISKKIKGNNILRA